jgi:translation initiation factor IF-3
VLLIAEDGSKRVLPAVEALREAQEQGLDLVEVAPTANPPVARILDYGKFKYEQAKKEREAHKHQRQAVLREVRFKPKIGAHDIDFKTKVVRKLLDGGDKVKVSVMFRGREITHPEIGRELLQRVATNLGPAAVVEKQPAMEGRFMNMILVPAPQKQPPRPPRPRAPRPEYAGPPADGADAPAAGETAMATAFERATPPSGDGA